MAVGVKSAGLDALIDQAQTTSDPQQRKQLYARLQHIIRDEVGMMRIREYIVHNPVQWSHDGRSGRVPNPPGSGAITTNHTTNI